MSEKRPPTPPPRRHQSQTERDMAGLAAKREREDATPADFASEEDSMAHDIPVRRAIRAGRKTEPRLEKLEAFKDLATAELADIKVALADVRGDQKAQTVTLSNIEKHLSESRHRERVTFEAHVDVDTAKQIDVIDAQKAKRQLWLKVAGIFTSGGIVFEILHRIGVL